jgi:hypothetical protein
MGRSSQSIIERIATGRGDDQNAIFAGQFQSLAIQPRVFPASVIDQVISMDELENTPTDPIAK